MNDIARLIEIFGVNILLSGDNAIVVAMAIRRLPAGERRVASIAGLSAAVLIQASATLTIAWVLELPVVSFIGGLLLGFIAIRLLRSNAESQDAAGHLSGTGLRHSIMMVIGAYLLMCLDNVLAVAAVGRGHAVLLLAGLLLSCALLIPASLIVANLMKRYPLTAALGAGVLGWTAGSMMTDMVVRNRAHQIGEIAQFLIPGATTAIVITSPWWWPRRRGRQLG